MCTTVCNYTAIMVQNVNFILRSTVASQLFMQEKFNVLCTVQHLCTKIVL